MVTGSLTIMATGDITISGTMLEGPKSHIRLQAGGKLTIAGALKPAPATRIRALSIPESPSLGRGNVEGDDIVGAAGLYIPGLAIAECGARD